MNIKQLGKSVSERRISLKIDQRALSEISGVAVHTISNIEAGVGNPTVGTLSKLLDAMGMEIEVRMKKPGE